MLWREHRVFGKESLKEGERAGRETVLLLLAAMRPNKKAWTLGKGKEDNP